MSAIDRVRILVLGDTGVGKTSFVHLVVHDKPIKSPAWTIGCSVDVKLHQFREGTPGQISYFIEFWDIAGSTNYKNTRRIFYKLCRGAILVHDLTNRKSEANLKKWMDELFSSDICDGGDVETAYLSPQVPLLFIGTGLDRADSSQLVPREKLYIHNQLKSEEIVLDTRNVKYLTAGCSNAVKLSRFIDRAIERRCHGRVRNKNKF